ncbi:hypothetical protein Nepgr_022485 [Nepenthes gracilis]|uniref:RNA-binding S4 domain-containing protein n=1 Tax=Nepenthes gracilis TaxID=150966 RepID=A0AAD3T115_NEPGR|nr:hypothetical protein Nepgr_022485 [Nepenthes gracilis]
MGREENRGLWRLFYVNGCMELVIAGQIYGDVGSGGQEDLAFLDGESIAQCLRPRVPDEIRLPASRSVFSMSFSVAHGMGFILSSYFTGAFIRVKTMLSMSFSVALLHFPPSPRIQLKISGLASVFSRSTAGDLISNDRREAIADRRLNFEGVQLEETVEIKSGKARLDSWISSRILGISRARVQSSIRSGLVSVNGRIVDKVSHAVRTGDKVNCTISELQPLRAEPEEIPLNIVYEDEHVLVVNKPPHMVVHPAPGNATGTLVNAILHHCSLPIVALANTEGTSEAENTSDDDLSMFSTDQIFTPGTTFSSYIRPGIVHRLDKGTSGLLVVAKDEHSHAYLSEQFKHHTVHRIYVSLTSGVPSPASGRVEIPIGRDFNNRIRMTAVDGRSQSGHARHAVSSYKVIEVLANGGSALVEWRLETGRTHQIRAHAKFLGIPLLGDEVYGGTKDMALSLLRPRTQPSCYARLTDLVSTIERPCLHAMVLGFKHPYSGESMHFSCPPPADFAEVLSQLRKFH